MTIRELIIALQQMAVRSPLGGETVVAVCDVDVEYRTLSHFKLDTEVGRPENGATALLFTEDYPAHAK